MNLQPKHINREQGDAGQILDQMVVAFLTALVRAILHRRGRHRARMQT
jgi:hypothetical protein